MQQKSGYSVLRDRQGGDNVKMFQKFWNRCIPNKVSTFNRMLLLNRIPTKVNLCSFCGVALEDSDH
ncbi:hypothetical protein SLEP1_g57470 [Rubroshorea leprosula]|uniref:Reverse transcriptase zinc-binding domain-containing protein n=1 Tax=Rubroshorea leprosula TaxID=152421 RepID=A0AAV5MMK4_9ROSI|nr:hypothetical protein SLEP1_g57470 [Rubroshorea leprosula]